MTTAEAGFEDRVSGQTGAGCLLTATGSGLDFEEQGVVFEALRGMFEAQGWQADFGYDGGGPTGMLGGYRQGNVLCLWLAGWEPSADADCPTDQPISACELAPEQHLYTITVNCAQDTSATDSAAASGLPREVPPEFQPIMQALVLTGVPPVDEGLPPIHPYVYTMDSGEYELSLDYGADCQGAGACHYGSLTGKQVDANEPVGTRNLPFEAQRAQQVALANGIEGYFVEATCGANCNDAVVFWIYGGFQYMVGLKGGGQADVIELANAAITNFVP